MRERVRVCVCVYVSHCSYLALFTVSFFAYYPSSVLSFLVFVSYAQEHHRFEVVCVVMHEIYCA